MPRLLPLSVVVSCVLLPAPAPAAAQAPLTEADAVARLSLESPRARAARAEIAVLRADARAAVRLPNPQVTFSQESVSGVTERFLLASQVLPVTGRRGLEADSAGQAVRAAELRADDLVRRLRAEVRRAFVELSTEEARERELEAALSALEELARVLARREAAGDAAGFDRLRAERESLDVAAELSDARARRFRAQGALAAFFVPSPDPASLRTAPLMPPSTPLPALDALLSSAEAGRPDLAALHREIDAARLAGQAAARSRVPEPELSGGLKTASTGDQRHGWVFSLGAAVPLFDRAQPELAQAAARGLLAAAQRDIVLADLRTGVGSLRAAAEERRQAASSYRREAIPRSDTLRRIAQISYDAGERGILELLDAYRSAASARIRLVDLDAASAHADIDLELMTAVEIRR